MPLFTLEFSHHQESTPSDSFLVLFQMISFFLDQECADSNIFSLGRETAGEKSSSLHQHSWKLHMTVIHKSVQTSLSFAGS